MASTNLAPGASAASVQPASRSLRDPAHGASLTESALWGMLWMSWGKAGRALLQLGVLAVLARLVTPADFGLVSAAFVVTGFAGISAHIGLGKGLVQHPCLRKEHVAVAFHTSVALGLLLGAATWLCAPVISEAFRMGALAPVLRVMAMTFPLKGIAVVSESLLQREFRFRWLANRELASYAAGYAGVGVLLAFAGWGVWALVSAHLAQTAVNTLLLIIGRPVPLSVRPERKAFGDLLYFSGGYTLGRLANQLAGEGDKLVVGRWLGAAALGVYGRAFQLMAVPADIIGDILDNVLFATLARVQEDTGRLANAYRRGVGLIALATLPVSVAFYLLAPAIVSVALGTRWTAAIPVFQLLAVGLVFRTSSRISDALARAGGFVYRRAWRQAFYAAFVVGGTWVGQHWGVAGAAFGVLLALALNFFLMAQLGLKVAQVGWNSFFRAHLPAILLAASGGLVMWLTSAVMSYWSMPSIALLVASIAAAACAGSALVWSWPRLFLGPDGLWMVQALRTHLPALRRVPLPLAVEVGIR